MRKIFLTIVSLFIGFASMNAFSYVTWQYDNVNRGSHKAPMAPPPSAYYDESSIYMYSMLSRDVNYEILEDSTVLQSGMLSLQSGVEQTISIENLLPGTYTLHIGYGSINLSGELTKEE